MSATRVGTTAFANYLKRNGLRLALPLLLICTFLLLWEFGVRRFHLPYRFAPSPSFVLETLFNEWPTLFKALKITLSVTFLGLATATLLGLTLGLLMYRFLCLRWALEPFLVLCRLMPVLTIAPLILNLTQYTTIAIFCCAVSVATIPILTAIRSGLQSVEPKLRRLFDVYQSSTCLRIRHLIIPSAALSFVKGVRTSASAALVGTVSGEFAAGAFGKGAGLTSRILEASYRMEINKLLAALFVLALTCIAIRFVFTAMISALMKNPRFRTA